MFHLGWGGVGGGVEVVFHVSQGKQEINKSRSRYVCYGNIEKPDLKKKI